MAIVATGSAGLIGSEAVSFFIFRPLFGSDD